MEMQRLFKPTDKVMVVCDYREKEVADYLKRFGADVKRMALKVGDFVCSERVCIELKKHADFIASIIDGRIFEQGKNMRENFEKPMIIIEGYSDRERKISKNALKAAIASLLVDFNVPIIATKSPSDTALTIFWIAKKEQTEGKRGIAIRVGKKPKELKRLQEEIVAGLPGVSTVLSKRLLRHFESIEGVFAAEEDELRKVRGVGKKLAKRIKEVLTKRYR